MNTPNCIIVLVGLPACGKTTLSHMIQEYQCVLNRNPKIIVLDQIFRSLPQAMDLEGKWHKARDIALEQCTENLNSVGSTVVIDDTNEYRSMRKPYFRLAQMKQYGYLEIHFKDFSYQLSLVRDSQRPNPVGPDTITNIAKRIEWTDAIGSEKWLIQFENVGKALEAIAAIQVPEPLPKVETLLFQSQNDRHIIDLQLRKCLKDLIEANQELKPYAKKLNEIRKNVLDPDYYEGDDYLNEFLRRVNSELN